ncbi:1-deoxy-D-xylulose-5-phosphate synthase [Thermoproteota archaeon]
MADYRLLTTLNFPDDLKTLDKQDLERLAGEIREKLVEIGDECGGHLASNLGVVELTIALHSVFNSPVDKIIWDVSHQSYVHKILTGRLDRIMTIRQDNGLSGFTKMSESPHDAFGAGHASTALSAALGYVHGRDLNNEEYRVCSIIGDGSLSGGMAFEALNNAARLNSNFVCILNDNDMSISKPVGSMAKYITRLRANKVYDFAKDTFERLFTIIPKIGTPIKARVERAVESVRDVLISTKAGVIFEEFGFKYLGPLDGHNIPLLIGALRYAKQYQGPVMIHIVTKKGKGHEPAENDPVQYHGITAKNGKKTNTTSPQTYTQVFGRALVAAARKDPRVIAITPAMTDGSGLKDFAQLFPDRFFDVGIAEEHAVTFAAGLAAAGMKPVLACYSTFLQRGFDQIIHDVCLQNLPVIFAIDRAGLVGRDGPTHHGTFDYSYLTLIPNMTVLAPKDDLELQAMLFWAVSHNGPVSIRYPRGVVPLSFESKDKRVLADAGKRSAEGGTEKVTGIARELETGSEELLFEYKKRIVLTYDVLFLAAGSMVLPALKSAEQLKARGIGSAVINLRFIKPLDIKLIKKYANKSKNLVILEEGAPIGGVYSMIVHALSGSRVQLNHIHHIALPDAFIEHGDTDMLLQHYGLTADKILEKIESDII